MSLGLFCTLYGIGTIVTAVSFAIVLGWAESQDARIPPETSADDDLLLMAAARG